MSGDLDVSFTWVPSDFLREQKIAGWSQLPVWVPAREGNEGWSRVGIARAVEKGLTFRPLADTAAATLAWHKTRPAADQSIPRTTTPPGAGLAADLETSVLAAWKAKRA
jgi:2'-hydroxyisoflavone reductase